MIFYRFVCLNLTPDVPAMFAQFLSKILAFWSIRLVRTLG